LGADINHTNGEANCSGTESGDLWIAKDGSPDTGDARDSLGMAKTGEAVVCCKATRVASPADQGRT